MAGNYRLAKGGEGEEEEQSGLAGGLSACSFGIFGLSSMRRTLGGLSSGMRVARKGDRNFNRSSRS
jgi:hypothetical protein